ncbi:hypothetical protein BH23BAC2_BH23BAC2_12560 [soil metagenome]
MRRIKLRSGVKLESFSFIILFCMVITSCGSSKTISNPEDFEVLKNLVNEREFAIEFQWAQPLGGSIIDLMTNPNYIRFAGNKVDIFLPYFGVRHRGAGYGSGGGGIEYEGEITNLNITENTSKKSIQLSFDAREETEHLSFLITLYENGKAHASVNSSDRNHISYQGGDIKVKPAAIIENY